MSERKLIPGSDAVNFIINRDQNGIVVRQVAFDGELVKRYVDKPIKPFETKTKYSL